MPAYSVRTETVGNITYVGQAIVGSAEGSPVWRIKRLTDNSGNLVVEYVDGKTSWLSRWTDRATYTYS